MKPEHTIEAKYGRLVDKLCRELADWKEQREEIKYIIENTEIPGQRRHARARLKQLNHFIGRLEFILARNRKAACRWHKDEVECVDTEPGCPNCSRMLATKDCLACGKTYLDWGNRSHDFLIASPCVNSSGDLCCTGCIRRIEEAEERAAEEEAPWDVLYHEMPKDPTIIDEPEKGEF
jgi:hypothetical protein